METLGVLGKYELRGTLGQGAMGTVYDGWDPVIARRVAIKTVALPDRTEQEAEERIARFRREAQAAGRLIHPNIVAVHDYGETAEVAYIVMEFVEGPTLKSLLDRQERFALPEIRRIMEDLLAGLQFCHERGVVHRDIKPANVMLTADRRAKIADFGIARVENSSMTQTGTVIGTPAYMAPEQFIGQVVDARADIYAAGVLLYQLLTGERPFEGSAASIMHKVLNVTPPAPSLLSVVNPPSLDPVVLRAMAKRPEDRFPSAAAFAEAIRHALDAPSRAGAAGEGEATKVVPTGDGAAHDRPAVASAAPAVVARRRPWALVRGGLAGLGLLALAGVWWVLQRPAGDGQPAALSVHTPAAPPIGTASLSTASVSAAPTSPAPASPAPAGIGQATTTTGGHGIEALRRDLTAGIAATACVLVTATVISDNAVVLTGFAGEDAAKLLLARLHRRIAWPPLTWQVRMVSPMFCTAIAVVRPITPLAGAPEFGLALRLAGGQNAAGSAAPVQPSVTMPHFAGYLRVDQLNGDGSVVHLYPPATAQPQLLDAGRTLRLGAGPAPAEGADRRALIIAVAASKPLVLKHTPDRVEITSARYLLDLESAIAAEQSAGAKATATLVAVGASSSGDQWTVGN